MATSNSVSALRLAQFGREIFICGMTPDQIRDFTKVSHWDPKKASGDPNNGYQRRPKEKDMKSLLKYIKWEGDTPPLLPNAIICNDREGAIQATQVKGAPTGIVLLKIAGKLETLDGQRRGRALADAAATEDIPHHDDLIASSFPVVIIRELDIQTERRVFININTKQRKVPTDLAYKNEIAFYDEHPERLATGNQADKDRYVGALVADMLHSDTKSPWRNKIRQPNEISEGKLHSERWISFDAMTNSLKPVIEKMRALGAFKSPDNYKAQAEAVFVWVKGYWAAIRSLLPDVWSNANDYALLVNVNVGVIANHKFLALLMDDIKKSGEKFDPAAIMKRIKDHPIFASEESWNRKSGDPAIIGAGNKGAAYNLASRMMEQVHATA